MRKAFSMITAIFVILLMASVAIFILNLSGKIVKGTTAQFQREQSMLLAKSYTEYAIMAVTANEHKLGTCLNSITGGFGDDGTGADLYTVNVAISYIGNGDLHANCNLARSIAPLSNTVQTIDSPLNIIVDVSVSYKVFDHPAGAAAAPSITYRRRSLQKI